MGKNWVVKGCSLSLSKGTGEKKIADSSKPMSDVFAGPKNNPKEVYAGTITIEVKNFTSPIVTNGDGKGSGTITGSSVNKADGKNIVLEGDSCTISISGTAFYSQQDPKHPVTDSVTVKIEDAGQSEVSSN